MEEISVATCHTWDRGPVHDPIFDRGMVVKIRIERFWLDTQKLSNVRNHTTLCVEHRESDRVGYKALEHGHIQIIRGGFQGSDVTISLQLLVVTNENQMLQ